MVAEHSSASKVMSRRSARLVSGGYYQSDEESDSSSVTNITYRESPPVRVFKKKAGTRKPVSRTSSRASSHASSLNIETALTPAQNKGATSALQTSQTQQSIRTVPYTSNVATPRPALTRDRTRPALTPDIGSNRTSTPTPSHGAPPESSSVAGLCGTSRAGAHRELNHNYSSGYSSAEGPYKRATASSTTSTTCTTSSRPTGAVSGFNRISRRLAHMTTNTSLSPGMKKALLFLLILIFTALCLWFLLPLLISFYMDWTKTLSPSPPTPVNPVPLVTSLPTPFVTTPPPAVDPTVVSTVVDQKMQNLLGELMLKQERLYSQMEERLQRDMQGVRARLKALDSDSRLRLEVELAGLSQQLEDYHTASSTATADLVHRLQAVEAQNSKLLQKYSSLQTGPPSASCAEATTQHQDQLSPEQQQAMEKWLADRIKKHDISHVGGREGCADCSRPVADKMADFALESQGASVVSTRCSETYRIRSACVTLFGFPLWYPSESPRTVIQGYPVLLPGKCWAFHGVQGTLVISLSHPIRITHVSLDHLPRCNSPTGRIDSAPRDFQVYGMINDTDESSLLGTFTYDQDGEPTQTFTLPNPSEVVHRFVELRILSNWGHVEYTCVYRFRVHGKIPST